MLYIIISKTVEAIESQTCGRVSNCTGDTGASQFQRFDFRAAGGRWCFHSVSFIYSVFNGAPSTVIRHDTDRREESCSGEDLVSLRCPCTNKMGKPMQDAKKEKLRSVLQR